MQARKLPRQDHPVNVTVNNARSTPSRPPTVDAAAYSSAHFDDPQHPSPAMSIVPIWGVSEPATGESNSGWIEPYGQVGYVGYLTTRRGAFSALCQWPVSTTSCHNPMVGRPTLTGGSGQRHRCSDGPIMAQH